MVEKTTQEIVKELIDIVGLWRERADEIIDRLESLVDDG